MKLNETQRAAMVLMVLGEDLAAKTLQYLTSEEVQKISSSMVSLPSISQEEFKSILNQCQKELEESAILSMNTNEYLRSILEKSMGTEKANRLLNKLLGTDQDRITDGIEMLNRLGAPQVFDLIKNEHPQIIATILIHINRDLAADILNLFDDELRNDVVLRIATFGEVDSSALEVLSSSLSTILHNQNNIRSGDLGGVHTAAEIINLLKTQQEESVINALRDYDDNLAQKILNEMFLFENLVNVDNRSIQRLLKDIDNETLIIALKGASVEVQDKLLGNMPQRAAAIVRDDLENRQPVKVSQVEIEQKKILAIVRRLVKSGEMIINNGEEDYV
jgi:flagellar motor switch protein FliG